MRGPKLSPRQEREAAALHAALAALLGVAPKPFDDELFVGAHDGVDGVQWHVSLDRQDMITRRFAVNLEGLEYRNWPIARFIARELEAPKLFDTVAGADPLRKVCVQLTRDAWAGRRTRVAVERWSLLSRQPVGGLSPALWRSSLVAARTCLASADGGRGKARLTRVKTHLAEDLETSPHLTFGVELTADGTVEERVLELRRAMQLLTPLHDFVREQST
jgi:hypothetical protein